MSKGMSKDEYKEKVAARIRRHLNAIDGDLAQCEKRITETLVALRDKNVKDKDDEVLLHITIKQSLEETVKDMEKALSRRFGLSIALDIVEKTE